jgi:prepilin-type N-terminal cleavage/methylation domain-containing protein
MKTRSAFTLLEVILALMIMALVMAVVSPALVGAMRAERQAHAILEPLGNQQIALELLTDDVMSAPQSAEAGSAQMSLSSTSIRGANLGTLLIFRDAAPTISPTIAKRAPEAGQMHVTWSVHETANGFALKREVDANVLATNLSSRVRAEVMLDNLAELSFEALDGGSWYESYDSFINGYFPRAIRVSYAFRLADGHAGPRRVYVIDLPQTAMSAAPVEVVVP